MNLIGDISEISKIMIINEIGLSIKERSIAPSIDIAELKSGLYIVEITYNSGAIIRKKAIKN